MNAEEIARGVVVYLPSVMFILGSAEISVESQGKVQFVAQIANTQDVKERHILVEGHTDSKGTEAFNMRLSEERAYAVANAIYGYGVDPDRTQINWFGESKPLLPNELSDGSDNPQGRATNRRVELIFLNNN